MGLVVREIRILENFIIRGMLLLNKKHFDPCANCNLISCHFKNEWMSAMFLEFVEMKVMQTMGLTLVWKGIEDNARGWLTSVILGYPQMSLLRIPLFCSSVS